MADKESLEAVSYDLFSVCLSVLALHRHDSLTEQVCMPYYTCIADLVTETRLSCSLLLYNYSLYGMGIP